MQPCYKYTQKACAHIHTALSCGPVTIYTESLCTYTHGPIMRPCYEYTQKACAYIHIALSCGPVTNLHVMPVIQKALSLPNTRFCKFGEGKIIFAPFVILQPSAAA